MKLIKTFNQTCFYFQQDSIDGYTCDICKQIKKNVPLLFINTPNDRLSICMCCNLRMIRDFNIEFDSQTDEEK